jgi:phage terminase large subunit GpA-like protein
MEVRDCISEAATSWAPPPKLTISQWADRYRILSPEAAAEPGPWKTLPFQKEIIDSVLEHERTIVMSSAQIGKTEVLLSVLGFYIAHKPAPILVVQPTLQMGHAFSKDRLSPMIRDTEALSKIVQTNRTKDCSNTLLHKTFRGGHVTISGANSPASLASRPIKVLLADEIDRYGESAGSEGDPLLLAQKRCATFLDRRLVFTSTPTVSGASRIEDEYELSSKGVYEVPCPFCEKFQELVWENIVYEKEKLSEIKYRCSGCSELIAEGYKNKIVRRGMWRHKNPQTKIRGFHLNELISPWRSWEEIAFDREACDSEEKIKVWTNTCLGIPYTAPSEEAPDWRALYGRREEYTCVPESCVALTAGADVQKDRVEISVLAHCFADGKKQTFVIEHYVIHGNTTESLVWKELSEFIHGSYKRKNGEKIFLKKICIDSQYRTTEVLNFCRTESRAQVIPVRGSDSLDTHISTPKKLDIKRNGRSVPSGLKRYNVGVSIIKADIYGRLALTPPTENERKKDGYPQNYIHFPELEEEYFKQLCAEKAFIERGKTGKSKYVFKKIYSRNEALDCMVYAFAGYYLLGLHRWEDGKWKKQLSLPSS